MNSSQSSTGPGVSSEDLAKFVTLLRQGRRSRVDVARLWQALAKVYPHRPVGPTERELLLAVLQEAADAGKLRLPPVDGRRWDRTLNPAVPTSVDLIVTRSPPESFDWRTYPWHQLLAWVTELPRLTQRQVAFLRQVQEGLVQGWFAEPQPLKYRSLQLTGGEKGLKELMPTALFAPGRLTLESLNCSPERLPLAWEPVGKGGRAVIFENAGPFAVARRVLSTLPDRPYDLVVYGGGRSVLASLGHLLTIRRKVESLDYVGDLDETGLEIAAALREAARVVGLPEVKPAEGLYRAMLRAAAGLGYPDGWSARYSRAVARIEAEELVRGLSLDLKDRIAEMLVAGRRMPEEVLGTDEMRRGLSDLCP